MQWRRRQQAFDLQARTAFNPEANQALLDDLAAAQVYCQAFIKRHAHSFYIASLLLPTARRHALWSIYAFCRYTDDLVDNPNLRDHPVAALDDWEEQILSGQPRHPVALVYKDVSATYNIPLGLARELISGVRMDLETSEYQTWEQLRLYCYRVASVVGLLLLPILGSRDERAAQYAIDLGIAMQLTNILRDVGEDARMGRVYLPSEDLARFDYDHERLRSGVVDDSFRALMRFEIERARAYYNSAQLGIALLAPSARPAILAAAAFYSHILHRIEANGYDVFTHRAYVSSAYKLRLLASLPPRLARLDRWRRTGHDPGPL
jgi:15-cis-phytoene synthase